MAMFMVRAGAFYFGNDFLASGFDRPFMQNFRHFFHINYIVVAIVVYRYSGDGSIIFFNHVKADPAGTDRTALGMEKTSRYPLPK